MNYFFLIYIFVTHAYLKISINVALVYRIFNLER